MQKRKILVISCSLLLALSLFVNIEYASAKSRKELLGDFLVQNQTNEGGFKNSNSSLSDSVTPFISYINVYLINELGRLDDIDQEQAESWFFGEMENSIITKNLTDMYYAYKGYTIVGGEMNETGKEEYASVVKSLQSDSDFGFKSDYAAMTNIFDTYLAVEILHELGLLGDIDYGIETINVKQFIEEKWDYSKGGFIQGDVDEISIIDTYYALSCLNRLDSLNLEAEQINNITNLINDHYINEEGYEQHYGGYGVASNPPQSSLMLTFYCIGIKDLIGSLGEEENTVDWVLDRQSSNDYGFQDVSDYPSTTSSSAINSYYAISTLLLINADLLTEKGIMDEELWELSIDKGVLAGIIVGVVGGLIIILVIYWKYRNRMAV